MTEPASSSTSVTGSSPRRASTTTYVVVLVLMVALGTFCFWKGTEPMGRRDLPGWVLGCVATFVVLVVAYILWRRSRGERSSLEGR